MPPKKQQQPPKPRPVGRPRSRPVGAKFRGGWFTDAEWAAIKALVKSLRAGA